MYGERTEASGNIDASSAVAVIRSTCRRFTITVPLSRAMISSATL